MSDEKIITEIVYDKKDLIAVNPDDPTKCDPGNCAGYWDLGKIEIGHRDWTNQVICRVFREIIANNNSYYSPEDPLDHRVDQCLKEFPELGKPFRIWDPDNVRWCNNDCPRLDHEGFKCNRWKVRLLRKRAEPNVFFRVEECMENTGHADCFDCNAPGNCDETCDKAEGFTKKG